MSSPFGEIAYHQLGGATLVNHRHRNPDSYELIHVLHGDGSAFILDKSYPVSPGTLLMIDAAYLHCITPADKNGYLRNKLIIDKQYLHSIFAILDATCALDEIFQNPAGGCFYLSEDQSVRVDSLFLTIETAFHEESTLSKLHTAAALLSLFSMCGKIRPHVTPLVDNKLTPALKFLQLHYSEQITVSQIAASCHMNKYYLCHLFRQQTGLTLIQYLYEYRLSMARQQLASTNIPIGIIAQNCGFGSSSHFCTVFRKREGVSPKKYRAMLK